MWLEKIIDQCYKQKFFLALAVIMLTIWGIWALKHTPLDALPDLSDTQVIIFTPWEGRSPDLIEDQITYPLVSSFLAAPKVKTVRGISFFGSSFVYIIFADDVDLYWARSRVVEYLATATQKLPAGVKPQLGPDATGIGWGFQYVLSSPDGSHGLEELRRFQDWQLRYWLSSVPGVSEVASVGGQAKEYQVQLDPGKLLSYGVTLNEVAAALKASNDEVGGRSIEVNGSEVIIRGRGYMKNIVDLETAVVTMRSGIPILVKQLGQVTLGPAMRRGIAQWNDQGEVVGGIVVVRFGENVFAVINRVKERIAEITPNLPAGIKIDVAYDRSNLIEAAVDTLRQTLLEESLIVMLICFIFLWHARSALVAILSLPLAILSSFIAMRWLGISANIMSLGGIAIAIGEMIDAAIVMVENAHKKIEQQPHAPRTPLLLQAAKEVGPSLFFSLLIIAVSFLPVFSLEGQEGRLFKPLAYTKTFAMAFAAIFAVTIVPLLMVIFIRGPLKPEMNNPLNRFFVRIYRPCVAFALRYRRITLGLTVIAMLAIYPLYRSIGEEFMPPLSEGTLLYMPTTTLPAISITEAGRLLQLQNKLLKQVPEVETVFGKAGRAETATDSAPLNMIETTIVLKPRSHWRQGLTEAALIAELDGKLKLPGVSNAWTMPIKGRIDMLTTGIRTPLGIKVFGDDLAELDRLSQAIEATLQNLPGVRSVYGERIMTGQFLDYEIDRLRAAYYGLNVEDITAVIETALAGREVSTSIDGSARYPITMRYLPDFRDQIEDLGRLLIDLPAGGQIPISAVTTLKHRSGPMMIRNEQGAKSNWILIDVADHADISGIVTSAKKLLADNITLPSGYRLEWSGQFEAMTRVKARLLYVVPITIAIVLLLLYLSFGHGIKVLFIALSLPFAAVGSFLLLWLADYNLSIAVWVGLLALAGVAAETGVVMILYLDHAFTEHINQNHGQPLTPVQLRQAVIEGAVKRVRPKLMTVFSTILGLLPIIWSSGAGADVMKRIAAPMIGGMATSTLLTLIVLPVLYEFWRLQQIKRQTTIKTIQALPK